MDVIKRNNKIIMMYSPQGGTGKSTVAVNTALLLANKGMKILLVDMAIYGSIMPMLKVHQKGETGLSAVLTFLDIYSETDDSNKFNSILEKSIIRKEEEKIDVLIAANPIKMESINGNYAKIIFDALKTLNYDYIIVDSSSELSEKNVVFIENADCTIIPVIQDITCGWKLLTFKEVMDRCLIDQNKFRIIVNKCNKYSGFNNSEFEKEIGYNIIAEIPMLVKKFQNYINKGINICFIKNKNAQKYFINAAKAIIS